MASGPWFGDALDHIHRITTDWPFHPAKHEQHVPHVDLNRDGGLDKDEVLKTRRVDEMEEFIEQEALRLAVHEMEERMVTLLTSTGTITLWIGEGMQASCSTGLLLIKRKQDG